MKKKIISTCNTISSIEISTPKLSIQREDAVQCLSKAIDVFSKPYLSMEEASLCREKISALYKKISAAIEEMIAIQKPYELAGFDFKSIAGLYWGFSQFYAATKKYLQAINEIIAILTCSSDAYLSALECAYLCMPLLFVDASLEEKLIEMQRHLDKIYLPN